MQTAGSHPLLRVTIADWGGTPDPFDLTPYLQGASVERSLREGMGRATLEVVDDTGQFDLVAGAKAALLAPNNGTVTIEMGEMLADGAHYWTVWTGGIVERSPREDATSRTISVEIGPRGNDLGRIDVTSAQYGGEGVTPPSWQANAIVKDLFVSFAGFVDPNDFNLTPLDFVIAGLQFEGQGLWEAAGQCLLPKGYTLRFGYDGRLESALLIPTSWTPVLDIGAIAIDTIEPRESPPEATRIMVAGGPGPSTATIGDDQKWATSRYAYDHPSGNRVLGGGDCVDYDLPTAYSARYRMAGPQGQKFRRSEVRNIRFSKCAGGLCPSGGFATAPYVDIEYWNADEERMECIVFWDTGDYDDLWIDFSFEVWGHPYQFVRPAMDVQVWDDNLISAWGDHQLRVDAPAAMTYELAEDVGSRELIFAQKSVRSLTATLKGLDLRVEAGDVVAIERPEGECDLWVHRVSHSVGEDGGQTMIEGVLV
jgi:hypothetical protein